MMYFWIMLYLTNLQFILSTRIRHFTHHVHRKTYRPITATITEVNPCHNGGTFTSVDLHSKVCVCPEKFIGEKCQDINYCYNKPCKNCGKCTVTPSYPHYTCECCKKYYGKQCELENVCEPNPCGRFGKCEMIGKNWTCTCQPGFKGATCNVLDNCYPNPCKNDGICKLTDAFGSIQCVCGNKWTGALCNFPNACQSNPCMNGAQCEDKNGDYACLCLDGFIGKSCAERVCYPNPCENEGTCIQNQHGEAQCVCPSYAKGEHCEDISPCLMNPCKNDAKCIDSRSGYTWPLKPMQYYCICKPPYIGRHCEDEPCSLCDINAYCSMRRCHCNAGYIGDGVVCRRQPDVCSPNPCYNDGTCIDKSDGTFECICKSSFHPPLCKVRDSCLPNPCNGGRCFPLPDGSFNCDCPQGFVGNKCEVKDPCTQLPCKHGGMCQRSEEEPENYTCICKGHWGGNLCEKCLCPKASHVRAPLPYCDTLTGACKCPGEGRFSKRSKICYYSQASRKSLVSACLPNPCKHNGVCIPVENSYDCKCPSRFTGPHCEVDKCLQCDENANCFAGECTCAKGYVGNGYRCQRSCAQQCLEFQFCSETGTCQCIPGYYMIGFQCFQKNDYSFKEPVWNTPRPFARGDDDEVETTKRPGKPHRPTTASTPTSRPSRKTPHSTVSRKTTSRHTTATPTTKGPSSSVKPPGLPPVSPTPSASVGPPGISDNSNDGELGPPGTRRDSPGKFVVNLEPETTEKDTSGIPVTFNYTPLITPINHLADDTSENSLKRENLTKKPVTDTSYNESYVKVEKELPKNATLNSSKVSNTTANNNTTDQENSKNKTESTTKVENFRASNETEDKHVGSHFEMSLVKQFRPTQPIMLKNHLSANQVKQNYIDESEDELNIANLTKVKSSIESRDRNNNTLPIKSRDKSNGTTEFKPREKENISMQSNDTSKYNNSKLYVETGKIFQKENASLVNESLTATFAKNVTNENHLMNPRDKSKVVGMFRGYYINEININAQNSTVPSLHSVSKCNSSTQLKSDLPKEEFKNKCNTTITPKNTSTTPKNTLTRETGKNSISMQLNSSKEILKSHKGELNLPPSKENNIVTNTSIVKHKLSRRLSRDRIRNKTLLKKFDHHNIRHKLISENETKKSFVRRYRSQYDEKTDEHDVYNGGKKENLHMKDKITNGKLNYEDKYVDEKQDHVMNKDNNIAHKYIETADGKKKKHVNNTSADRRTLKGLINENDELEFVENNLDNYEAIWNKLNKTKDHLTNSTITANRKIKQNAVASSKRDLHSKYKLNTVEETTSSVYPHLVDYADSEEALESQNSEENFRHTKMSQNSHGIENKVNIEEDFNNEVNHLKDDAMLRYISEQD